MNKSYLEACCGVLERNMEYPSDELLVSLVRTQYLAQSISLTFAFTSNSILTDLPLAMIVESFRQQIEALRASLPGDVRDNRALPRF